MRVQDKPMQNDGRWMPSAIPFFMFGFFYYLITPYFSLAYLSENKLIGVAQYYIDLEYFNFYYLMDVFSILFFWLCGYLVSQRVVSKRSFFLNSVSSYRNLPRLIFLAFFFLLIVFIVKSFMGGAVFFSGYDTYDVEVLGPFATMVYMVAFFYNYFFAKSSKLPFFLLFVLSSVILLGFGSRMFFVLGSITIILGYISSNPKILKSLLFYTLVALLVLFVLGVGIWRASGETQYSFEMFLAILLVEPLFTATTGALFFENHGGRPLLGYPVDIFASFINFIPSFVFPSKKEFINGLTFDAFKYAPFGASSIIVNLYSNFGIFYPLYMFAIGCFYGFIRSKSYQSNYFRAVYFTVLPLLMFHFFREGFITVIKALFFNGFVLPLVIIVSVGFLFKANKVINPVPK